MSPDAPLEFRDDPEPRSADPGPPEPESTTFFVCPRCRRAVPAKAAAGTPTRCPCGHWIPSPAGPLKGKKGPGPHFVCTGCNRIGEWTVRAEGRVFSCAACGTTVPIHEEKPPAPPPPVRERLKAHARSLTPIVRHELTEMKLPQTQRCAERFAADREFRKSHWMCPTCRHGCPKESAACGFCGMVFDGENAEIVREFNADLTDEIRAGAALRSSRFIPGAVLCGSGALLCLIAFVVLQPLAILGALLIVAGAVLMLMA